MELPLIIEILGVVFGLGYIFFATKNSQWCWPLGIIGSILSIWLFIQFSQLYSEALLSFYYVIMGFYGWWVWKQQDQSKSDNADLEPKKEGSFIHAMSWMLHGKIIALGVAGAFALYYLVNLALPDAEKPLFDAFTTAFSFLATWLTARRLLENWIYWVVIDACTVVLYLSRDLYFYAGLMGVYTIIATFGYLNWKRKMELAQ